jgi:hypothetical protein
MSHRGSIYDHQFHIRPEAATTFGETIAMYLAQYFDLHPPQRGAHGQQFHFFTLHENHSSVVVEKDAYPFWAPALDRCAESTDILPSSDWCVA